MILICKFIFFNKNFIGISIFPFIILRKKELLKNKILINHEKIHLRQQLELFVFFFYLWYILEFLILFIRYKNAHQAYRNISFEKEAYQNEKNLNFLKSRKFWNFLNFY